jgi:conjugal transfer pilus assembly protein TraU
MNTKFKIFRYFIAATFFLSINNICHAICCDDNIEKDDIAWDELKQEERGGSCTCYYGKFSRSGTLYTFWEPARIIETVKDPKCMMAEGKSTSGGDDTSGDTSDDTDYTLFGTTHDNDNSEGPTAFLNAHIVTPDYIKDSLDENNQRCWHTGTGDTTDYISEDDSAWNDEAIAAVNYPEVYTANKFKMVKLCMLDSATAQFGFPIDAFYWCMGSWGTTYPIGGHVGTNEYITAAIAAASRALYIGGRTMRIMDTATYYCFNFPMILWIKSYFKFQPVKPTKMKFGIPIGQSPMLWESGLDATTCNDNFAWVLWRKRWCCDSGSSSSGGSGGGSGGSKP